MQVNKKGWAKELEQDRTGLAFEWICYLPQATVLTSPKAPTPAEVSYTEKELQARAIMQAINAGKTIKEIAE